MHIGFCLKRINNLIRRDLDARFTENGLSELIGMQGPMIDYIHRRSKAEPVFQKDLEKEFHIRRSTATVMLQNLEQKAYITREPVDYDARLKQIVLTEKAVQHNQKIHQLLDKFNEELEYGITPEEKEMFCQILGKITNNIERKGKTAC